MAKRFEGLRRWSRKLEEKKLPKGAILFPIRVRREVKWKEIDTFRRRFNVDDLFVIHGVAFKKGEVATIVCGPNGIGKSTSLRKLAKAGKIEPTDDSMVLIGRDKASRNYFVFETGCYSTIRAHAVASRVLRVLTRAGVHYTRPKSSGKRFNVEYKIADTLAHVALLIGRILTKNRSSTEHTPRKIPLKKAILAFHPKMVRQVLSVKGRDAKWQAFEGLKAAISKQAEIVDFNPMQKNSRKKLSAAMA